MARLLSDQPETSSGGSTSTASAATKDSVKTMGDDVFKNSIKNNLGSTNNSTSGCNAKTSGVSPRKLSFKLRNANSTSHQNRSNFRATKVTLPSNSVATLANKFNAVIIQNDAQGRALLKKLNSTAHAPTKRSSKPVEGSVRAAVQKLETNRPNHHDRPKLVVVRKHSSNKNSGKSKTSASNVTSNGVVHRKLDNVVENDDATHGTIDSSVRSSSLYNTPKPKVKPSQRIGNVSDTMPQNVSIKDTSLVSNKIEELNKNIVKSENESGSIKKKKVINKIDRSINGTAIDSVSRLKSNLDGDGSRSFNKKPKESEKIRTEMCKNNAISNDCESIKDGLTKLRKNVLKGTDSINSKRKEKYRRCVISSTGVYETTTSDEVDTKTSKRPTSNIDSKNKCNVDQSWIKVVNDDTVSITNRTDLEKSSFNVIEKAEHRLSLNSVSNKPKIQPKPYIENVSVVDQSKKKISFSTMTLLNNIETKPETILNVQEKKFSLAKDQSDLEDALNETSFKSETINVSPVKEIDVSIPTKNETSNVVIENKAETASKPAVQPNRSFLWRNLSKQNLTNIYKQNISEELKQKESLIIAGVKHNVESKLNNNSCLFQENKMKEKSKQNHDDKPVYMNGSVLTNFQEISGTLDRKYSNVSNSISNLSVSNSINGSSNDILSFNDKNSKTDFDKNHEKNSTSTLAKGNSKDESSVSSTNTKQLIIEEKENVRCSSNSTTTTTMYEEFENTRNTSMKTTSFLYRNIYITEENAKDDIAPLQQNNESDVFLNNYEELQDQQINPHDQPRRLLPQVSTTSYISSKLSYGYVDPGSCNYEDLEDNYASIPENEDVRNKEDDFSENIYDDVLNVRMAAKQLELSADHYESVYHAEISSSNAFEKDSDSSCDQSNSLYGIAGCRPSSRTSSVSYHLGNGQPTPRSETSDEWMDVDNSDNEEILVLKERDRPRLRNTSAADGWCQKVRRQRSKKASRSSPDGSDSESNNHQYESLQNRVGQPVCDDFDGSFDSDSSFDDVDQPSNGQHHHHRPHSNNNLPDSHCERTLPSVPSQNDGLYGFMKQAGRKMTKHWSIGKSLRRIRKMSVGATANSAASDDQAGPTNGSSLNRRRWSSFKNKFKTQTSSSGSTFYLDNDQLSYKQDSIDNYDKQSTITAATTVTTASNNTSPRSSVRGSTNIDPRRFSMSSLRPTSPPPPPPPLMQRSPASSSNNDDSPKRPSRSSNVLSCYSETDGFDNSTNGSYSDGTFTARSRNTGWYSDAGLWDGSQIHNNSAADSGSEHSSSHGSDLHLRFADEPLYQFYNATVTQEELNFCYSTADGENPNVILDSEDGYEEIGDLVSRPSAMDLISPKSGHHRRLWCEISQVRNSEILMSMSKEERRLQEAKFEVMTSEASYFKSLTVLEKHFAASPLLQDESVLSSKDRKSLFGYVTPVRKCSERLLSSIDRCWQDSIMLSGICDILHKHALQHFQVYVSYCSNQIDLNATLRRLKDTNKKFEESLIVLESDPKCESLSLHSFLMLPMQRITRMPLLVDAILSKLEVTHPEYSSCQQALKMLNEFVQRCNEETRQQERVIEMVKLSRQLEFSKDVRTLPIVSKNRWLVRSGQVLQLNSDTRQTFGRKFAKQGVKLTLFLFNDVLLLTRKKSEESYLVIDHCQKNLIQMSEEDDIVNNSSRYLIKLAMLKNHEGKLVEMILGCDTETCRQRWMQAFAPLTSENPGEAIYESWDCPQVVGIHSYISVQPDELSLQKGDIINVLRKMIDGWYYGERTRDGEKGWFPGNHVHEIISAHVRARNLHQRYRLLTLSGSYLLQQQQNQVQTNKKHVRV